MRLTVVCVLLVPVGLRLSGPTCPVLGFGVRGLGFGVKGLGCSIYGVGFSVQGSGFRVYAWNHAAGKFLRGSLACMFDDYAGSTFLSHSMIQLNGFEKSTLPQNRQLFVLISDSTQKVDDFVGELTI